MRQIPVAREGLPFLLLCLVAAGATAYLDPVGSLPFLAAAATVAFFFRDPERVTPASDDAVVSPADGRVREVVPARGEGDSHRISIYLSLLDVHVNRFPVSGRVSAVRYSAGRFLPAFLAGAGRRNESNLVMVDRAGAPVGVRQIAGMLARRIVCYCRPGQPVRRGERLGLIRFGSCVELTLPGRARLLVAEGQRVRAGETAVAILPAEM